MKQKKQFRILTKLISVILCLCLMFTGCITGAAFFSRPSTSVLEKRKLTEFPKFTMTTFLNGQYFSEISTWYSDTYPMRDSLMSVSQNMKNVYGIHQDTMVVGTKKEADAIPTYVLFHLKFCGYLYQGFESFRKKIKRNIKCIFIISSK